MAKILNGGIYSVVFTGRSSAEFNGNHPAVVFQTMKEPDIFISIPLTSYTKERWDKVRKEGFAVRLHTTNSIARVDKMQIIHRREIRNRWKEYGNFSKITPSEIINLKTKVDRYIFISTESTNNDYQKYYQQYEDLLKYINERKNEVPSTENYCTLNVSGNSNTITIPKSNVNKLPATDILEIIKNVFTCDNPNLINNLNLKHKGTNPPFIEITFEQNKTD